MRYGASASRRVLAHLTVAAVAVAIALGAYWLIRHDSLRAEALSKAALSPAAAGEVIAGTFGSRAAICHPPKPRDDVDNLVSGLFALERFGVSPFEAAVERWIARLSLWLRLAPPDLSYGAGQIRLSRAIALVEDDITTEPGTPRSNGPQNSTASRAQLAIALLDPCFARKVARRLIETALSYGVQTFGARSLLDYDQIIELARVYNAQASPGDAKAILAHRLFNQIAYHLTLHYRYADARSDLPPRARSSTHPNSQARPDVMAR